MKKKLIPLVMFVLAFIATYLVICFAIPGMRIKLEAEPAEYFFRSLSHMALFKAIISFVCACILGAMTFILLKKK